MKPVWGARAFCAAVVALSAVAAVGCAAADPGGVGRVVVVAAAAAATPLPDSGAATVEPGVATPADEAAVPASTATADPLPATPTATPTPTVAPVPTSASTTPPTDPHTATPIATPTAVATRAAVPAAGDAPTGAPSRVVSRGRTDRRAVTLTFDAGADRGHAARILDELARQGVHAAFGVTGKWAETNRDLVARIQADGHELINHTYDHPSFTGVSWSTVARTAAERTTQLARTERSLAEVGAASGRPYFRPPFGDYDASVLADVGRAGYSLTVMWTVDSMGWRGLESMRIAQRCLEGAAAGAIYIFHVGAASQDAEALPAIIEGLRARGFEIASLADLLGVPGT